MVNSIKINLAAVYAQSKRELDGIALTKECLKYAEATNNLSDAGVAAVNIGYFYEWIEGFIKHLVQIRHELNQ